MNGANTYQSGSPKRRSRWRGFLTGCLVTFITFAVCAVVIEKFVDWHYGEQVKFPRRVVAGPAGVRINQPGATYRHRSPDVNIEFAINSRGFRSEREYDYPKDPGTVRIVSIGDSFTSGYEVEVEQTFSRIVERELNAAGVKTEVINAGVSGYSNAEALVYLERELIKYQPDIVLLSFYTNDHVDNVRSGLFRVSDGALEQMADSYIPMGKTAEFLNRNVVFNWLAENSDAFAKGLQDVTLFLKRQIVEQNMETVAGDGASAEADKTPAEQKSEDETATRNRLTAAIINRIHDVATENNSRLFVQSIPILLDDELIDAFPLDLVNVDAPTFDYLAMKPLLDPHKSDDLLYWRRSHGHWTPFSHEVSGTNIAKMLLAGPLKR